MKLFISINLKKDIKYELLEILTKLKEKGVHCRTPSHENIHLTLVFIGEIDRLDEIIAIMNQINQKSFIMKLKRISRIRKKRGGDLLWVEAEKGKELLEIETFIKNNLIKQGFIIDSREFLPHITLGRNVRVNSEIDDCETFSDFNEMDIEVSSISLMQSVIDGAMLKYKEIFKKEL